MREIIMAFQGEMSLKGLNRRVFEAALVKAIKKRLEPLGSWKVYTNQSAVYALPLDEEAFACVPRAFARLEKIFGIATLTRAAQCEKTPEAIFATAEEYLAAQLEQAGTFKVTAKRADKTFPMNSMEIGRELGAYLLERHPRLRVDVHSPELLVTVEVRESAAYVHGPKHKGAGGLPVPTSGRAALLLSGGIDSPVAAWQMAKRGLALVAVHFASPPYTSPRAAAKVEALAAALAPWAGPLPYYAVPYTKTQEYLRDHLARQDYFTVMMRRSMLRIAHTIAQKERCEALITGESLAQVASQTLGALHCTNTAQELPVLRPCIGMDKTEITALARRIGTFDISIQPYEDCCTLFTPPHPKTKPRMADVLALEEKMPDLPLLEAQAAQEAHFQLILPE